MKSDRRFSLPRYLPAIRLGLLAGFLFLLLWQVSSQYEQVQALVRTICSSCLGLGG